MVPIKLFQMDLGRAEVQSLLLLDTILYTVQATVLGATVFSPCYAKIFMLVVCKGGSPVYLTFPLGIRSWS